MTRQRVVFRADAGRDIGYGHFIRSLALAGYLKDDFDCHFATFNPIEKNPTDYQLNEISKVAEYLPLTAETTEAFDEAFMGALLPTDIVVLDNYFFTTEYQKKIKALGCKLVSVDDMHNRHFVSDLLISICPESEDKFDMADYTRYVGGIEWLFLRSAFLDTSLKERKSQAPRKVVLAIGGADPFNLTNNIIAILLNSNDLSEINVIAGDTVKISDEYLAKVKLHRRLSAEEIVNLFDRCDMGIFPASTTCFEALSRSLPVACGWYVDNQEEFYHFMSNNGHVLPLGNFLDPQKELEVRINDTLSKASTFIPTKSLDFKTHRDKTVRIFHELSDGCYLRPVRDSDLDLLFEWTNDSDVRANSFNSAPIKYEGHCRWFEHCIKSDNVLIYILIHNSKVIGQARLTIEGNMAEIGYSIAREHRGKGYGNIIIKKIVEIANENPRIEQLLASVKPENASSLKVFEKNGFNRVKDEEPSKVTFVKTTHSA